MSNLMKCRSKKMRNKLRLAFFLDKFLGINTKKVTNLLGIPKSTYYRYR